jgi:hypothetical protein
VGRAQSLSHNDLPVWPVYCSFFLCPRCLVVAILSLGPRRARHLKFCLALARRFPDEAKADHPLHRRQPRLALRSQRAARTRRI